MNTKKKFFILNSGGGYSAEAQNVFDNMATELPSNYKTAIAIFIDGQVALSQWSNVIECWLFANDTSANSNKGWNGVVDADLVGSPTHSPSSGFSLNGSSQYISSNFIPNTHASGFDAKLSVGAFIKENRSTANARSLFGAVATGGAGKYGIDQVPTSAAINVFAGTSTQLAVSEGSNDDKIFDSETEYTSVQLGGTAYLYKDGILISSAARANTGLTTVDIFFGALNVNNAPFQYLDCTLSFGYVVDPTGFDFREFHLGIKTMLQALGVYSSTPELTIPSGGEWFDFSQSSVGNFTSLVGRKSLLTALGVNTPTIEAVGGVNMLKTESSGSKVVDLASVFQTFYDGSAPASFSILITVKPIDGTPASAQALFGHTNSTSGVMYARIGTDGKVTIGFKEADESEITTVTNFAVFGDTPSNVSILIFEFLKDEMIVEVNGIKVSQTETSWGTRTLTDFNGGSINMYLGCENVDGTPTNVLDGYIGDFMIRRGAWSQSQKERLLEYFS